MHVRWLGGLTEAAGDGQKLSGVLQGEKAELTWTVEGKEMAVEVTLTPPDKRAGLYRTEYAIDDDEFMATLREL